jgi:hypothetical protein
MVVHVKIRLRLKLKKTEKLRAVLQTFAKQSPGWKWAPKQSADYQKMHQGPAGFVICDSVQGLARAAVAVANVDEKHPHSFEVTNIVPQESFSLTMSEYNSIGTVFCKTFKSFLKSSRRNGVVTMVGPEIGLNEIITAPRCRWFFEKWLQSPTPTSHPSDVRKLDNFCCAMFRYGADVDLNHLGRHLVDDRKWQSDSAAWAMERIQTGLDVLKANLRF